MKAKHVKTLFLSIALILGAVIGAYALGIDVEQSTAFLVAGAPLAAVAVENFDPSKISIPQAEFEELKKKHRHIYVVDIVLDEDERYQFIVKRPSRDMLSAVAESKGDLAHSNKLILNDMVLAGDKDALDDGLVYSALMKELGEFMKSAKTFLTKA